MNKCHPHSSLYVAYSGARISGGLFLTALRQTNLNISWELAKVSRVAQSSTGRLCGFLMKGQWKKKTHNTFRKRNGLSYKQKAKKPDSRRQEARTNYRGRY